MTVSFRGLDAPAYYVLRGGYDVDITGTGNTLDSGSPTVVRMVCDAMRNWATAFGVDGFRIDLASVLGRPRSGPFDPHGPLLTAIATDPVLSQCKLIAEPWDATGEGYRVGGFPACSGRSGTAATATPSATSGAATARSASWRRA